MRKLLKIIVSFLSAVVLLVLLLPVALTVLFSSHRFQNYVVQVAARYASGKLGTTVSVDNIRIKLFNRAVIDGFYVEDLTGDTLLYMGHIEVGFRGYNPVTKVWRFEEIKLSDGCLYLRQDSTSTMNIKYITEKLKRDIPEEERNEFIGRARKIELNRFRLTTRKYEVPDREGAMNFADLDFQDVRLHMERFRIRNDNIRMKITDFTFREKSGLRSNDLTSDHAVVSPQGIYLTDLHLRDDYSDLQIDHLDLEYDDWTAFVDFEEKVIMNTKLKPSSIAFRTLAFFSARLSERETVLNAEGWVRGTVDRFSGRFDRLTFGDTRLTAEFGFTGLPDFRTTDIVMDIEDLRTESEDIRMLLADITGKETLPESFRYVDKMGRIDLEGMFRGTPRDFSSSGKIAGDPGMLDFSFDRSTRTDHTGIIQGDLTTSGFDLGSILEIPDIGSASFVASVNGILGTDTVGLDIKADVEKFDYKEYVYNSLEIEGKVEGKNYRGTVRSTDPNLDFDLAGRFLNSRPVPRYDFRLELRHADLVALGLNQRDSVSAVRGTMRVNAAGLDLETMNGEGVIGNLTYFFNADTLRSENIRLEAINYAENKHIGLYSDILDVDMASKLDLYDIIPYAKYTLKYYLPSLYRENVEQDEELEEQLDRVRSNNPDNFYLVSARIKNGQKFTTAILPGLYLEDGTEFSLMLNPATNNFSLMLNSGLVEYKNLYISNLIVTNRNQADSIALYARTDEVGIGNFYMPGFSVVGGVKNNLVNLGIGFNNQINGMSAMLNSSSRLVRNKESGEKWWNVRLNSSYVSIEENQWRVSSPRITVGQNEVEIDRFRVFSGDEDLTVYGRFSENPSDTLHIELNNFDIAPLSGLLDRYGYSVSGKVDGHADLFTMDHNRLFYAELSNRDIGVNGLPVQNSFFRSFWDPDDHSIRTRMVLESGETVLSGGYSPSGREYSIDLDLPRIDLALLSPVLEGVLTDIEGEAEASLSFTGSGNRPFLNGTLRVPVFAATVDFTQVRYRMENGVMDVKNNNFQLRQNRIYDAEGGSGEVTMQLTTDYLADLKYKVRVTPERLIAMDIDSKDNDLFYGKVYASGEVAVEGERGRVSINVSAQTENNSQFYLPLTNRASVADADFIVFVDPEKQDQALDMTELSRARLLQMMRERRRNRQVENDLQIHMDLRVIPNTTFQLVIDPTIGDILKGNGMGNLTLNIRPNEDIFTIYGDYEILEGDYLFTMMNILNKYFTIERGSSIRWVGDPIDAILDITATYRLRTSLSPILSNQSRDYKQTVPVECIILLTDRLSQPTLSFDVTVPTADSEIRSAVQSALNTQELKSQQFIWLLATNSFYADNNSAASNIGTTATTVTGLEFLTNQFSNWLSTNKFSFNLGYRPKNNLSSDELEASFTTELIPNKLLIEAEANYNLGNTRSMNDRTDNQLTGDFSMTYNFDQLGNFRGKVFTRTIDRYDENQGLQEHGLGIYYKKDFDTFADLFRQRMRKKGISAAEDPVVLEIEITTENDGPVE